MRARFFGFVLTLAILIGGTASSRFATHGALALDATENLDLAAESTGSWTNVTDEIAPPARAGSMMAYSTRDNLFVLFGGWNGEVLNDTWVFDSSTRIWSKVYTPHAPVGRGDGAFVYDSQNDVFLLFGGWIEGEDETYVRLGDTWAFHMGNRTWSELHPSTSPSNRSDSAIAYDTRAGVVLLFGGFNGTDYLGDVWAYSYSNNTWFPRSISGAPSKRADGRIAYDEADDLFFLFGGNDYSGPNFTFHHLGDTWTYRWETDTWTQVTTDVAPEARDYAVFAYDPDTAVLLLVGGYGEWTFLGDTWAFDLHSFAWIPVITQETPPPRFAAVGEYGTRDRVLVLFSGLGEKGVRADTWFLRQVGGHQREVLSNSLTPQQLVLGGALLLALTAMAVSGWRLSRIETKPLNEGGSPSLSDGENRKDEQP